MSITFPVEMPTSSIGIESITFSAESVVSRTESPFTFSQQILRWPGQRWVASIKIPPCKRDTAESWVSFLLSLNGPENTFYLYDPLGTTPQGEAGGTPLVNGASQTGSSLVIDGATTTQTDWLKAGDWIQLGTGSSSKLHKVVQDVDTDGSGNATLEIWPDLRSSPADDAAINLSTCKGVFRLKNNISSWNINSISSYGIEFEAVEAL